MKSHILDSEFKELKNFGHKGRLLDNELDDIDVEFENILSEFLKLLKNLTVAGTQAHLDLPKDSTLISDLMNIFVEDQFILPRENKDETYPNLLKALEILMCLDTNKDQLERLPEKHMIKKTIQSMQDKIISLLSTDVQWKDCPAKIKHYKYYDLVLINYAADREYTYKIDEEKKEISTNYGKTYTYSIDADKQEIATNYGKSYTYSINVDEGEILTNYGKSYHYTIDDETQEISTNLYGKKQKYTNDNEKKTIIAGIIKDIISNIHREVVYKITNEVVETIEKEIIENLTEEILSQDIKNFIKEKCEKSKSPVILKCGFIQRLDKDNNIVSERNIVLCYGLNNKENKNQEIIELEGDKFNYLRFNFPKIKLPTYLKAIKKKIRLPEYGHREVAHFLPKKYVSYPIQREIAAIEPEEEFKDLIFNKSIMYDIASSRHAHLPANVSEMILLGFERFLESLSAIDKEDKSVKHIHQLILNSKYKLTNKIDAHFAYHLQQSQGGTKYQSTNGELTWLGLVLILNYVFNNKEVKNSKLGQMYISYLKTLRKENTSYLTPKELALDDPKDKKDAIKGVICNRKKWSKFIKSFQYMPICKNKTASPASKLMNEVLENIVDHLYRNHINKKHGYLPKAEFVVGPDGKSSCIFSFPQEGVSRERKSKNITYKDFDITALLRNQPSSQDINLSLERRRYLLSAMIGCGLYFSFSGDKKWIQEQIASGKIPPNSCIVACEKTKKIGNNIIVKNIYYINYDKKIETLSSVKKAVRSKDIVNDRACKTLAKLINGSTWMKGLLSKNDLTMNNQLLINFNGSTDEKLYFSINHALASEKLLFLQRVFVIPTQTKLLDTMRNKKLYQNLSPEYAVAIIKYTSSFYTFINELFRKYFSHIPANLYMSVLPTGEKNTELHLGTIKKVLGDNFATDPYARYCFLSEVLISGLGADAGQIEILKTIEDDMLKEIKEKFSVNNCHLYLASNKEEVKRYKNENKGYGIIIQRAPKSTKLKIKYCLDNQYLEKMKDINLTINVDTGRFLNHFSDQNSLTDLAFIERTGGRVNPKTEEEINLVNQFIQYATWYRDLNTLDYALYRGDGGSFFTLTVRPEVLKKLYDEGFLTSAQYELLSTSVGACPGFMDLDALRLLTVIHVPKSLIPLIMGISEVPNEDEALLGFLMKLVYFKVVRGFRDNILHAVVVPNLNDRKFGEVLSSHAKSQLYTSIQFMNKEIESNDKKILAAFSIFVEIAKQKFPINELESIKPYLTNKYSPTIQLSSIEGTSVEIITDITNNELSLQKVKQYIKTNQLENTYVILPIKNDLNDSHLLSFKLFYVNNKQSIKEIVISQPNSEFISQLEATVLFLSKSKNLKPFAKECMDDTSIAYLDTLIREKDDHTLPFITGLREKLKKEKRKSRRHEVKKSLTVNIKDLQSKLRPMKTTDSTDTIVDKDTEDKLKDLTTLIVKNCLLYETRAESQKEIRSIETEEAKATKNVKDVKDLRLHQLNQRNTQQITALANDFVKIIKSLQILNDKKTSLSKRNVRNLKEIEKMITHLQQDENYDNLFAIIKKRLEEQFGSLLEKIEKNELPLQQIFKDRIDDALFLCLCIKLIEIFPAASQGIRKISATYEDLRKIVQDYTGEELVTPRPQQHVINRPLLEIAKKSYHYFLETYPSYADIGVITIQDNVTLHMKTVVNTLNEIINICESHSQNIFEKNKSTMNKHYGMICDIIFFIGQESRKKGSLITEQNAELGRMLEHFKHLLDPIVVKFVEIKLPSPPVRKRLKHKEKRSLKKLPIIKDSIETPTISESTTSVGSGPSSSNTPLLRSLSDTGLLTTSNTSVENENEKLIINIESAESKPIISDLVHHSIFTQSSARYLLQSEKLVTSINIQTVNRIDQVLPESKVKNS